MRHAPQFVVHERDQRVERVLIPLAPGEQEPGNVARVRRGQGASLS
jgi:hypothetical protein